MERIEISNPNVSLSDIVKHVSRDRISVELSDGQVPLAIIVPIDKPTTMADLDRALCVRVRGLAMTRRPFPGTCSRSVSRLGNYLDRHGGVHSLGTRWWPN
jgi:hypothetical protein